MSNVEVVAGLCTALTFSCSVQILITCFLAFAFSQFMSVLHCNLPTAAGVISGLVTVPTVIQFRAAQVSIKVVRRYGYTIWYKRLAIGICSLLQFITWLCTVITICTPYSGEKFLSLMENYSEKQSCKSVVDNIQWFLQCCGGKGYQDWYNINWGGFIFDSLSFRMKKSIKELLYSNDDEYPDLSTLRNDNVPFSCCAEVASSGCVHQNLQQFGTYTINTAGCTNRLAATKQSILLTEFVIYTVCLCLEISILVLLKNPPDPSELQCHPLGTKYLMGGPKPSFSKFLNEIPMMGLSDSK